jgi:hypothetical protein
VGCGAGQGWEKLDTSHPLPALASSAVWRYKAIFKKKGAQIGQWCEPVSISAMGQGWGLAAPG